MSWAEYWKVDSFIPEGQSGNVKVGKFEVSERDASFGQIRAFRDGRGVPAGSYTRLMINGVLVMSDTLDERRDHSVMIDQAQDQCLINGLGLGCVLRCCLENRWAGVPCVNHITVVEKNEDVIKLVAPSFQSVYGDRVEIIHDDALTYRPPKGVRYDAVWHDIWTDISTDNLPTMQTLHRRYGSRCDWQGSWKREYLLYMRRKENENPWYGR